MDSLGGILIKGLLGNPILAHFNLFFFDITITVPPDGGGHGGVGERPSFTGWTRPGEEKEEEVRTITISVKFKAKEFVNTYELTEKKLRITINILDILTRTVNKLRNISLKFKKTRD